MGCFPCCACFASPRSQPLTRPVKKARERKRRLKAQKKRLVALGVPEAGLDKLTGKQVREMLRERALRKKQA